MKEEFCQLKSVTFAFLKELSGKDYVGGNYQDCMTTLLM